MERHQRTHPLRRNLERLRAQCFLRQQSRRNVLRCFCRGRARLLEDGRAFALADFDHDGRLEVFSEESQRSTVAPAEECRRRLCRRRSAFRLQGTKSNRDAIGAAITVETERPDSKPNAASRIRFSFAAQQRSFLRPWASERAGARVDPLAERPGAGTSQSSPSITGSGVQEGSEASRAEPFRINADSAPVPSSREFHRTRSRSRQQLKPGCWRPLPRLNFLCRICLGQSHTLSHTSRQAAASQFLWTTKSESCREDLRTLQKIPRALERRRACNC